MKYKVIEMSQEEWLAELLRAMFQQMGIPDIESDD